MAVDALVLFFSKALNDLSRYLAARLRFQTSLGESMIRGIHSCRVRGLPKAGVVAANMMPRAVGTPAARSVNVVMNKTKLFSESERTARKQAAPSQNRPKTGN